MFLRGGGNNLPDYTASHPWKLLVLQSEGCPNEDEQAKKFVRFNVTGWDSYLNWQHRKVEAKLHEFEAQMQENSKLLTQAHWPMAAIHALNCAGISQGTEGHAPHSYGHANMLSYLVISICPKIDCLHFCYTLSDSQTCCHSRCSPLKALHSRRHYHRCVNLNSYHRDIWRCLTYAVAYAIRKVQENPVGLKLNGTHQLQIYTDDVNLFGDNIYTIKKT
jgi:hypothetical protein